MMRTATRIVGKGLAWFALAIGIFMAVAWIGSAVPRNSEWEAPDDGVTIMVETNGIHTGIVMPLVTPHHDWRNRFPASDLAAPDAPYTHVSVSWGERTVFLETPTWGDLKLASALRAAIGSEGLLHVAHYIRPAPGKYHRELVLRPGEYVQLVAEIEQQIAASEDQVLYPGYAEYDVFYTARGTYHIGNSCNQWTSDRLAAAGVETGWWTPFPGGVMKWVPRAD
ncbi:MAG: DUF2459 domain-containing protein [Parerythrobacter sp.]